MGATSLPLKYSAICWLAASVTSIMVGFLLGIECDQQYPVWCDVSDQKFSLMLIMTTPFVNGEIKSAKEL